ncbi:hypothetical protein HaLaN_18013 [Haematococcus lacustris]|uniref:Uncharacterized protein n=1 Tax=Haematococcus lacustris TaxID=44745 RepID=A0A699ZFX9_HAELA|nr:hypothetical protein HaLaN_18013 [Haematococcus lacustris]
MHAVKPGVACVLRGRTHRLRSTRHIATTRHFLCTIQALLRAEVKPIHRSDSSTGLIPCCDLGEERATRDGRDVELAIRHAPRRAAAEQGALRAVPRPAPAGRPGRAHVGRLRGKCVAASPPPAHLRYKKQPTAFTTCKGSHQDICPTMAA